MNIGEGSEETFEGITDAKPRNPVTGEIFPQRFVSKQQIEKSKRSSLDRFDGLPFTDSVAAIFTSDGTLFGQLSLVNSSTDTAYRFSSLALYTDLDAAYYNMTDFDSAAARASGTLALDIVASSGNVELLSSTQSTAPMLTYSTPNIEPDSYVLLIGVARPILSDGTLGPEVPFSFAVKAVPEPSTLALLGIGIGALAGYAWRRRKQKAA